jgi:hypothetical protein
MTSRRGSEQAGESGEMAFKRPIRVASDGSHFFPNELTIGVDKPALGA